MGKWFIEKTEPQSAEANMRTDYERLKGLSSTCLPSLRFYSWNQPAATYGYFLKPWDYFNKEAVEELGMNIAQRPTGGGIIFHTHDLAFSIIVDANHDFYSENTLKIYQRINSRVLDALQRYIPLSIELLKQNCANRCKEGFCMTKATIYDLLVSGRKVGGAAVRKTRSGLLYQGSLCLGFPDRDLVETILKQGPSVYQMMQQVSYPLKINISHLEEIIVEAVTCP